MENDCHTCHHQEKLEDLKETPRRPGLVSVGGRSMPGKWMLVPLTHVFYFSITVLRSVIPSHFKMDQGNGYLRKASNKSFNTSIFLECELILNLSGTPGILYK